jgi:hypothetical protein
MLNNFFFFPKIGPFMRQVEKYYTAGEAIDDNVSHVYSMLDT